MSPVFAQRQEGRRNQPEPKEVEFGMPESLQLSKRGCKVDLAIRSFTDIIDLAERRDCPRFRRSQYALYRNSYSSLRIQAVVGMHRVATFQCTPGLRPVPCLNKVHSRASTGCQDAVCREVD